MFFFTAQRRKGTLVFSEGRRDMKETEEEHFKRFLTKDKAEIEALRDAHQRFTGIIKKQAFWFNVFHILKKKYRQSKRLLGYCC